MPFAVREAAPDEHVGVATERRGHLPREPRLPDPGWPERRDEVTRSVGQRLVEGRPDAGELVAAAHERRVEPALERRRALDDAEQTMRRDSVRLPFQLERLDRLDLDRVPRQGASVVSPSRISPGSAACSSRAATLTASPVTSASPGRRRLRRC